MRVMEGREGEKEREGKKRRENEGEGDLFSIAIPPPKKETRYEFVCRTVAVDVATCDRFML